MLKIYYLGNVTDSELGKVIRESIKEEKFKEQGCVEINLEKGSFLLTNPIPPSQTNPCAFNLCHGFEAGNMLSLNHADVVYYNVPKESEIPIFLKSFVLGLAKGRDKRVIGQGDLSFLYSSYPKHFYPEVESDYFDHYLKFPENLLS